MRLSRQGSIEQWAMETEFSTPLEWGEIEREVLRRRHPRLPDEPASARVSDFVIDAAYHLWLAVIIGAPLWALIAVLAGVLTDGTRGDMWVNVARLPLVATVGVPVTLLVNVRRGERFAGWEALLVLADAALSFACYVILATATDSGSANATAWVALIVTAVSLLSLAAAAMVRGRARSGRSEESGAPDSTRRATAPSSFYLRQRCLAARESVLGILDGRGLVDLQESKKAAMLKMPLGSWDKVKS